MNSFFDPTGPQSLIYVHEVGDLASHEVCSSLHFEVTVVQQLCSMSILGRLGRSPCGQESMCQSISLAWPVREALAPTHSMLLGVQCLRHASSSHVSQVPVEKARDGTYQPMGTKVTLHRIGPVRHRQHPGLVCPVLQYNCHAHVLHFPQPSRQCHAVRSTAHTSFPFYYLTSTPPPFPERESFRQGRLFRAHQP